VRSGTRRNPTAPGEREVTTGKIIEGIETARCEKCSGVGPKFGVVGLRRICAFDFKDAVSKIPMREVARLEMAARQSRLPLLRALEPIVYDM